MRPMNTAPPNQLPDTIIEIPQSAVGTCLPLCKTVLVIIVCALAHPFVPVTKIHFRIVFIHTRVALGKHDAVIRAYGAAGNVIETPGREQNYARRGFEA